MARRRGWKSGDWLVRDEESGFVRYASEVTRDYYGVLKDKKEADEAHPQDFIRAKQDPYPVDPIAPPTRTYNTSAYVQGDFVGLTTVPAPFGPATHIFNPSGIPGNDPGIGQMEIGTTFTVR
jgi:hypothetical protein